MMEIVQHKVVATVLSPFDDGLSSGGQPVLREMPCFCMHFTVVLNP